MCGKQIDMTLRYPNPMSASLDHKDALARGGAPLDPANAAACHLVCNRRKGTKNLADVQPVPRSKDWYATPSPGG